jgi:hypothetical protein
VPPPLKRRAAAGRLLRPCIAALVVLATGAYALAATSARAATGAALHASFAPDRLGATTVMTLALDFAGGSEGVPEPLRTITLRLPAGLHIELRGTSTCAPARLRRSGAAGLQVHAGSQTIPEQAQLWAYRGPSAADGAPTLEILGVGSTPLQERTVSRGVLRGDGAPFGSSLTITVPPIPTVAFEPNASFDSLSLALGALAGTPPAHRPAMRLTVPRHCTREGFRFAVGIGFADHSSAAATAAVPCP